MIGQTISHYKIIAKLGEGGMGEVFLAEDTELERKVALKFLPPHYASEPDVLTRFKREAKAAAALNHPNIVTVYEVGEHEGRPFIAMAYIEGDVLGDLMIGGDLAIDKALDIVEQLCDGLGKAHEASVVHRDIKPDNIFVDSDGRVKILDFGLATKQGVTKITQEASTLGTLYYMSPEQTRGQEVDHRSDIFSLGVVLYQLIAGRVPFEGEHSAAVLYAIGHEEPQPLSRYNSKVTPELERIVKKALAKKPDDRYQTTADLAVDLKHAYDGGAGAAKSSKRVLKYGVPASAVFLVALLVLIFKPFKVEIAPDQTAEAVSNKLAIMYFENMVDPDDQKRLGEIVTDLLITNLSRTEDLQVVSSQRLYDILKLKGKEGAKVIDQSTSTEVAREAGAKWMMLGRILQVEPTFVVSSQLIDMATGNVVNSQRVTGGPGETIFEIVDRMTGDTKGELDIPIERGIEDAISVADVTTNSLEAYRHYLEGEEASRRFYRQESSEAYLEAVEADSTFAMAWLRLAMRGVAGRNFKESRAAIAKAVKYSERASEKERLYIDGYNAYFQGEQAKALASFQAIVDRYPDEKDAYQAIAIHYAQLEDYDKAIENYNAIIAIDPMNTLTYNQLAYAYDAVGKHEQSIQAIDKYIEMEPGEPNPYDSRGDLYAYNGNIEKAIESYQKAIAIKPDFYSSVHKLGDMYLYQLDEAAAEAQYRRLAQGEDPALRSLGRTLLAAIPIYRGRFDAGLDQISEAIAADEMEGFKDFNYLAKFFARASVYASLEDCEQFYGTMLEAVPLMKAIFPPRFWIFIDVNKALSMAQCDRREEAQQLLDEIEPTVHQFKHSDLTKDYYLARGTLAKESGDLKTACEFLEMALALDNGFEPKYALADAYLEAGRNEDAIGLFEEIVKRHDSERIYQAALSVKTHYLLGEAYEKTGQRTKAAEQYRRFLEIWGDGDPQIKEIPLAKTRLAALQASG